MIIMKRFSQEKLLTMVIFIQQLQGNYWNQKALQLKRGLKNLHSCTSNQKKDFWILKKTCSLTQFLVHYQIKALL
jgi:ribosomal protein L16 Arg81 hydroxylase